MDAIDIELKCNSINCRQALRDNAVVTTCYHIFCVQCAKELFTAEKTCPACEVALNEPDDIVVTCLHPSEDYKSSVLAGLAPSVILDIASRAIRFWTYQAGNEICYQSMLGRNLQEKYSLMEQQAQAIVREANATSQHLREKINGLEREFENEKRKQHQLSLALNDRHRQVQKLQLAYDHMKRKMMLEACHTGSINVANGGRPFKEKYLSTPLKNRTQLNMLHDNFARGQQTHLSNTFHQSRQEEIWPENILAERRRTTIESEFGYRTGVEGPTLPRSSVRDDNPSF